MDKKYKFVCRVCLVKDSSSVMRSLADNKIRQTLIECTSISITPEDKYPQQICSKCWIQCSSWSIFQSLAQDSDRQLRLEEQETEDDPNDQKDAIDEEHVEYVKGWSLMTGRDSLDEQEQVSDEVEDEELNQVEKSPLDPQGNEWETPPKSSDREGAFNLKDKRHMCGYCGRTFNYFGKLRDHERTHTNERPFQCDNCGKRFHRRTNLDQHKSIHTEIRPFECDQCERTFHKKTNLDTHKLLHTGVRPHKCSQCDYRATEKATVMNHERSHSQEKTFICKCNKRFRYKHTMAYHVKTRCQHR